MNDSKQRLIVLGAGESGVGAAILGKAKGWDVFVSDRGQLKQEYRDVLSNYEIAFEEGSHDEDRVMAADLVVKSPGIPDTVPMVVALREQGTAVISEIEFGGRYTDAKIIAVTGSNGKTTTTLLVHHILKKAGFKVGLAGNVGRSFARQVAEENFDHYVLELSSFQLDGMCDFRVNVALLLNITSDHLDRYDYKLQNYVDSKLRITQNQTEEDVLIYWHEDPIIRAELEKRDLLARKLPFSEEEEVAEGGYLTEEKLVVRLNQNKQFDMSIHDLALKGKHNTNNSLAAGIAGKVLEIRKEIIRQSLTDFQNVEHRLEFVAKVHGIEFVNDSKATNVNATWYALESIDNPVIWIAGGVDKGNDYSMLFDLVAEKVKAVVCLGKDNSKLHRAFEGIVETIVDAGTAMEAVAMSYRLARKGDSVLLSPACASFDLFENFEDRGQQFKKSVRAL